MKNLFIVLAALFINFSASAQGRSTDYSTENKKAIKLFEQATAALTSREHKKAEGLFKQAIQRDENFTDAYIVLSELYLETNDLKSARKQLEKAISIEPRKFMAAYFYLGEINMSESDYEAAIYNFTLYQRSNPPASPMSGRAARSLRNCSFAQEALKNPVPFEPINFGPSINTKFPEYYPTLTLDEDELLFTRRIENANAFNGVHEDFYVSNKENDQWENAKNLRVVNTLMNEGAPSYSANGRILFFTACQLFDDYGAGRTGYGSCDLFYAYKEGKNWTEAMNLGGVINSGVWESQPSFSADGKTLYFVRGKRSGQGISHQDIWSAELSDNGTWSKPAKIPGLVNTPEVEESVFIHPDGQTLYFASDGHPGMGGLDLFMSRKHPDGSWGEPVNLGYPINTAGDENSLLVSSSGSLAVFASDRPGGFGDLDLYHFELPENVKPRPVTYAEGLIYDAKNFRPLDASFELVDLETGASVAVGTSDKSGEFLIPLPVGKEYMVSVSREGYMFHSENFKLKTKGIAEPYELNVPLKKITTGNSVVLQNVFFDTDSYELKESSKIELGRLVSFMNLNPDLRIEIGGHTDNIGSDTDNVLLSKSRAESVAKFVVDSGIVADRVSAKGYGETAPIDSNKTDSGRAANRRTEFKIN